MPANTFLLSSSLRVEKWLHTQRIQAAALHQVGNSETVGHSSLHVPDSEVKPLRVLVGVHVSTQGELIVMETTGWQTNRWRERDKQRQ